MREMNLTVRKRRKRIQATNSNHSEPRYPNRIKDTQITGPNEAWVSDITYVSLRRGFAYLAITMDVHTRAIRGWNLSKSLDGSLTMEVLNKALAKHPAPQIHHSDKGCSTRPTNMWLGSKVMV